MTDPLVSHNLKPHKDHIDVAHINIRQSISILIMKIVFLDIFSAVVVGAMYLTLNFTEISMYIGLDTAVTTFSFFLIVAVIKISLSMYVVLDWINEYYEVTPSELIYRRGVIYVKEEKVRFSDIRKIELRQGLLGRIFNFGNLILYDFMLKKDLEAFLIHNPQRYLKILSDLIPDLEITKSVVRESIRAEED